MLGRSLLLNYYQSMRRGKLSAIYIMDEVYCETAVVRNDHFISSPDGIQLLEQLNSRFANYANFSKTAENKIGSYLPYRDPYVNPSISWYDLSGKPSAELLDRFGATPVTTTLMDWYGLKFDMATGKVLLKAVARKTAVPKPELPVGNRFYATTHDEDRNMSEWVDAYVMSTPEKIQQFCAEKELAYPLPADFVLGERQILCWGVVFNFRTFAYGPVKAYVQTRR